jgi:hypothetical protein
MADESMDRGQAQVDWGPPVGTGLYGDIEHGHGADIYPGDRHEHQGRSAV